MRQIITRLIDVTFGKIYTDLSGMLINLEKNKNKSNLKFISQHHNDEYWDKRSCGIACVQMILDYKGNKVSAKKLIKLGLDYKGYDTTNDIGWYHHSLVKLLKDFGVSAKTKKYVSSNEIAKILSENNFVIASIDSKSGGHLILIYDYKLDKNKKLKYLIYNDPWYLQEGANKKISKSNFDKISKRRVIIVDKSK